MSTFRGSGPIYIDPPYNTGNDFVYQDDYADPIGSYLERTGQVDEAGKLSTNSESAGRFHSNWLNMMYPRLKLARNLLTDDGVMFISIDDSEQAQLRRLVDEVFGEANFVSQIVWEKVHTRKNSARQFSVSHDYIICVARRKMRSIGDGGFQRALLPRENSDAYSNPDSDPKGPWKPDPIYANNPYDADYVITKPDGTEITRPAGQYWRYSKKTIDEAIESGALIWGSGASMPMIKRYLSEVQDGLVPVTLFTREFAGDNSQAKSEVKELFDGDPIFSYPKPTRLIQRFIQIAGVGHHEIVLDFFAGSGTTAHAVTALNADDDGARRCISVQLPEPTDPESDAHKLGYETISEVTRERIRRAGKKILEEEASKLDGQADSLDVGFRAYKLVDTNFTKWKADSELSEDELVGLFSDLADSANDHARPEALLTEVLLKLGFSLTEKIETVEVAGLSVFSVADGLVMAYLDEHTQPNLDQLRALVAREPERLVVLEDAFQGNDELKTNLVQECRTLNVDLWTA
ncbi:site-specific DNA-methyltransferase [Corynebacterium striatum]|nr:site-specific DNA-methyltransferase [Corynebacterium striatum]HAT1282782.1 site-specific DNA-methyltransferase [Corynebacterium striatum]HAT1501740.1 site-specific DNA-methyltransferase [Corynebacterium striatum]